MPSERFIPLRAVCWTASQASAAPPEAERSFIRVTCSEKAMAAEYTSVWSQWPLSSMVTQRGSAKSSSRTGNSYSTFCRMVFSAAASRSRQLTANTLRP